MSATAPTAAKIIEALARQRFQTEMGLLAELDSTQSEAVRAALAAVPRKSKIEVRLLLESVRREITARAEARSAEAQPWRYAITLMSPDQREQFRALVASGADPDAAAQSAMQRGPRYGLGGLGAPSKSHAPSQG